MRGRRSVAPAGDVLRQGGAMQGDAGTGVPRQ